ncbi:MAG: hypothetical protein RR128_02390, partial [Clostridium sp.]
TSSELYDYLVHYNGNLYIPYEGEIQSLSKAEGENLWIDEGNGYKIFDLRGVNLGLGKPGKFATEYSISKEEYLRWFEQIQEMGANVIRTYTLAHEEFYEAFYEYNVNNDNPLYLIHGVWVDDYMLNSHRNAFDDEFYKEFLNSCKDIVDVIHGRLKNSGFNNIGSQSYDKDISPWVYGYIVGVEWESDIVAFTNETGPQLPQYEGEYMRTENAGNFEIFLATIGDEMIGYETNKYGTQRTLAFANWPTTDPFEYPEKILIESAKYAQIDVDNIKSTDKFISGQYASYHIYPYYPDFLRYVDPTIENTYLDYLTKINEHHEIPVVISEFGVPSSRGMAAYEDKGSLGRNQGMLSEDEQGAAIISMYEDIKTAGSAGGIVFIWQDEWFKRTWNTMEGVDLENGAFWSNYQTNEQCFGLLTFDPGKEQSICYVDGDKEDWKEEDVVLEEEEYKLSMKYDEKFMYFLVEKDGFDIKANKLYIPMDITPKTGTTILSSPYELQTNKGTDFVISINGEEDSRVLVQDRYDFIEIMYGDLNGALAYENPPKKDSTVFSPIRLPLNELNYLNNDMPISFEEFDLNNDKHTKQAQTYETGKLTYGNANPSSGEFNSLADFCGGEGFVEIKLPWQLLNFSDPSEMKIHDDYYERYGVEYIKINEMNVGVGDGTKLIEMEPFNLKKLGGNPKYHERLKESYYMLKDYWTSN